MKETFFMIVLLDLLPESTWSHIPFYILFRLTFNLSNAKFLFFSSKI